MRSGSVSSSRLRSSVLVFPLAQAFTPGLVKWREFLSPIYGAFANTLVMRRARAVMPKPPEGGL